MNTNLNKNFHTESNYHSFKPLFLFFQIAARSSLKKIENEKWPKAGYHFPPHILPIFLKNMSYNFQINSYCICGESFDVFFLQFLQIIATKRQNCEKITR